MAGSYEAIEQRPANSVFLGYNGPLIVRLKLADSRQFSLLFYGPVLDPPKAGGGPRKERWGWIEVRGRYTIAGAEIQLVTQWPFSLNYPALHVRADGPDRLILSLPRGGTEAGRGAVDEAHLSRAGEW